MSTENIRTLQDVLGSLKTGAPDLSLFTPDARWWWNGGIDVTIAEFAELLGFLDGQVDGGIVVTPGFTMAQDDSVIIEATSHAALENGKAYNNRYIFLAHFEGPLIREVREYSDSAHVLATFELPG